MNDKKLKKRLTADTIDAIPHHLPGITGSVYSTLPRETFLPGKDTRRWPILVAAAALCVVTLTAGLLAFFPPPSHSPVLSNYSMDINRVDKIILWTHESERQLTAEETSDIISQYNASEYGGKATGEGGTPDFGLRIFTQDGEAVRMNDFYGKFEVFTEEGTFYLLNEQLYQFIKNLAAESVLRQTLLKRMIGDRPDADSEILTQHYQDTPVTVLGEASGYVICSYPVNPGTEKSGYVILQGHRINGNAIYDPSPSGLYAVKGSEVLTLEDACYQQSVDIDAAYELIPRECRGGMSTDPDGYYSYGRDHSEAQLVIANLFSALNSPKETDLTVLLTDQGLAQLDVLALRQDGETLLYLFDSYPDVSQNTNTLQYFDVICRFSTQKGASSPMVLSFTLVHQAKGWRIDAISPKDAAQSNCVELVQKYCDAVSRGDDETVRSLLSHRALSMPRKALTAPVSVEFTSDLEPVINGVAVAGDGWPQAFLLTFNSPAYFSEHSLTGEVQLDFLFVFEGGSLRIDGLWDIQGNPLYP